MFRNCAPFTKCISEINNTQVHNTKDLYVVMPMYNLIEYPNNCSKTSGSLWQYYRDNPIAISAESESFESNLKTPESTPADRNGKNVEVTVPLKYLSNF